MAGLVLRPREHSTVGGTSNPPAGGGATLAAVKATESSQTDQQRVQLREMVLGRWRKDKAGWETRIKVDLPAALRRRDAGAPDYQAAARLQRDYEADFGRTHRREYQATVQAMDELSRKDPHWKDKFPGMWWLEQTVSYLRATADPMPLPGAEGRTIGSVADDVRNLPRPNFILRNLMEDVERRAFANEEAARQVASIQSNAELSDYLQAGAEARYNAKYQQMLADYPLEPALKNYLEEEAYASAKTSVVAGYVSYWNAEVYQITNDYQDWMLTVYSQIRVGEDTKDIPEVREMLTDMQDLKQQLQQMVPDAR